MDASSEQAGSVTENPEPPRDYFAILGLCYDPATPPTAQDVVRAYRQAAKRFHPDRNPQNPAQAKQNFELVCRAYETLRNVESRSAYEARLARDRALNEMRKTEDSAAQELVSFRTQRRNRLRLELEARERRASLRKLERKRALAEQRRTLQDYQSDTDTEALKKTNRVTGERPSNR